MRYARLDRNNAIVEFVELTQSQYDSLSLQDRAPLYEADLTVTDTHVFEDRWYSAEEIRDREYAADPAAYIDKHARLVHTWRAVWFAGGFTYQGNLFKGEANDQLWMTSFSEMLTSGITSVPVHWITKDNQVVEFATIDEFRALAAFFFNWAQSITFQCLQVKAGIRAATSRAEVDALYMPFAAARRAEGLEI